MKPRHLSLFIAVLLTACGQNTDSASNEADTVAAATVPTKHTRTKIYEFTNTEFFETLTPFEMGDQEALTKWFPDEENACESYQMEDGTPWYDYCYFDNGTFRISYHEFSATSPQQFYFGEIFATDPDVKFGGGVHAGMTRKEVADALGVDGPKVEDALLLMVNDDSGLRQAKIRFIEDVVSDITIEFQRPETFPMTDSDLIYEWTEVTIEEPEGQREVHVPCGANKYRLTEELVERGDEDYTKVTLDLEEPQFARTDLVEWIRRTEDGFLISALENFNESERYSINVVMKDSTGNYAEWNGVLYIRELAGETLYNDPCDGEEQP